MSMLAIIVAMVPNPKTADAATSTGLIGLAGDGFGGGDLIKINVNTGAGTSLGTLTDGTEIECAPNADSTDCFLQPGGTDSIIPFDRETVAFTGPAVATPEVYNGLEYVGSTLYGTSIIVPGGESILSTLDPLTGFATFVGGGTGAGPISGLAYGGGVLYGIEGGVASTPGATSTLFSIDMTTGVATPIGDTGMVAGSLQFGPDGGLYAGGGGVDSGDLWEIDPLTGAGTFVGSTGFGRISGLTYVVPLCEGLVVTINVAFDGGIGTPGDDVMLGTAGDDSINGKAGDDTICGRGGNDTILGGSGDDVIQAGGGNDNVEGGSGKDRIRGGDGNDMLRGGDDNDNINGNNGNDKVFGDDGNDYLAGKDGKDVINGGDGNDTINGGGKSDILRGGKGNDKMNGNAFSDDMFGGGGKDTMNGGDGSDVIQGNNGNDTLLGGRGNDFLGGGGGNDTCDGKTGVDTQSSCETQISIPDEPPSSLVLTGG